MPSLNLDLDYWDHPKTRRLIGLLGRGAESLPIRLWCYCGKYHRKDGSLSTYTSEEIETLIDWRGPKGKALEALVKVGFLDETPAGIIVHDWADHAGHLEAYARGAKIAAKKRWEKRIPTPQDPDKQGSECEPQCEPHAERNAIRNAPAVHGSTGQYMAVHTRAKPAEERPPEVTARPAPSALVEAWNANRGELAAVRLPLSGGRERHARARLAEEPDVKRWGEAVARLARSSFATGKSTRGTWKADFDFLVKPDSLAKIEEGKYDDRTSNTGASSGPRPPTKWPSTALKEGEL